MGNGWQLGSLPQKEAGGWAGGGGCRWTKTTTWRQTPLTCQSVRQLVRSGEFPAGHRKCYTENESKNRTRRR